jgi:hypothetical protein
MYTIYTRRPTAGDGALLCWDVADMEPQRRLRHPKHVGDEGDSDSEEDASVARRGKKRAAKKGKKGGGEEEKEEKEEEFKMCMGWRDTCNTGGFQGSRVYLLYLIFEAGAGAGRTRGSSREEDKKVM